MSQAEVAAAAVAEDAPRAVSRSDAASENSNTETLPSNMAGIEYPGRHGKDICYWSHLCLCLLTDAEAERRSKEKK